ncbi:Self-incomp_S1 domain-containing protein [Cephalotus follicularis]|uniref:S-protein homolog n=1 Tax=Cephalotus follicularis TaxID=3775 RepID=A0A1Q3B7M0_CEPFO|nr:Self-incomp_S1 domain-containing protein [Cephalotus follicularis]
MKQSTLSRFYLCMFLLALCFGIGTCWDFRKYHVYISNYLEGYPNTTLEVHCKSGDDDLGLHSLPYYGDTYGFKFRINYFGTTLFFCDLWWNDLHVVFDAFVSDDKFIDQCGDHSCNWDAQDDGIYLDNNNIMTLKYKWSKGKLM